MFNPIVVGGRHNLDIVANRHVADQNVFLRPPMCCPEFLAHFHERCNVKFLETFERPPLHGTSRLPSRYALRCCLTSRWLNVHFATPRGHDERVNKILVAMLATLPCQP
jgi:hypothetical protein